MLIKVIGLGSPFGDDAIGLLVVSQLEKDLTYSHLHFEMLDRPGVGLLSHFAGYDKVIIIDAMKSGAAPGTLLEVGADALHAYKSATSSHDLGLVDAILLGGVLEQLPNDLRIIGIEVSNRKNGFSEEEINKLTEEVGKRITEKWRTRKDSNLRPPGS